MNIDPGMFPDVADALGVDSPAIVEKDVYAVQLLCLLSKLRSETFELVFAGGTSLAKAHHKLFRMSEDIDIKLVIHQDRYERFIGPLVYHDEPATWGEALQTVVKLAQQLLPDGSAES
ncbi:hypothetical protein ELY33_12230 [Vreelandella andesensis]|uniref:Nucleotidyl transferase AbiEii/AbiGii toxin family protein n=1 Tax=Vreelandella andesensis TaxID=447567 RepID=A0A433KJM8_9GAMM|nr:nucleotidyl transferase AbiEii/AbiGii toxin family protein [Halomonas andesensis]RUR29705.1 hypothetical protein ELY33_12230 [Halomonas andesensis]